MNNPPNLHGHVTIRTLLPKGEKSSRALECRFLGNYNNRPGIQLKCISLRRPVKVGRTKIATVTMRISESK